ncbi:MAG: caspase domain-containing protein [Gemmataceae bacterium]
MVRMKRISSVTRARNANQRALVIGISDYPNPRNRLPAVSADLREMAKILSSRRGTFRSSGVTVLANKQATRRNIDDALRAVLLTTTQDEPVFVYLAGHGISVGGQYYFVAYDTVDQATGLPLAEIRSMFDECRSKRAFLWLDFCHSGGIVARGQLAGDKQLVRRELDVVRGEGKIIVAACTAQQSSYEDPSIGHGLFTDALIRGLRGEAKTQHGDVTANSLYDFIARHIQHPDQQPMLFGHMTGIMALAHYPARGLLGAKTKVGKAQNRAGAKKRVPLGRLWVMLGDNFFIADTVRRSSDNKIEITATSQSSADTAMLNSFRSDRHRHGQALPFAFKNEAHSARVGDVHSEATGKQEKWKLQLKIEEGRFGNPFEGSFGYGGKTYSADDIARLRAGRVLLNDPAPWTSRGWGHDGNAGLMSYIEGSGQYTIKNCVIRDAFVTFGGGTNWKEKARLKALFLLKAAGVVDQVLELVLGQVRANKLSVRFRGIRQPSRNETTEIAIEGECPLDLPTTKHQSSK